MKFTIHRSFLVVLVSVLVIAAGVFVAQRASATSATPVVYVATGEDFPDALAAASAAAVQGGPVLLLQKHSIPAVTRSELSRLDPDVIYVAGGADAVSQSVFDELHTYAPSVMRVSGLDRYATAAAISQSVFPVAGGGSAALNARVAALEAEVNALKTLLTGVSRDGDTMQFTGMNLRLVNGRGTTDSSNGLGNLIVGYNEAPDSLAPDGRVGSHYLVVGKWHSYTKYGGIVAGIWSTASGKYSSVTGGYNNEASGNYASVTGGAMNIASGPDSAVTGGAHNTAAGSDSTVSGGYNNASNSGFGSILGGEDNSIGGTGLRNTVVGGDSMGIVTTYDGVAWGEGFWEDMD